MKVVNVRIT